MIIKKIALLVIGFFDFFHQKKIITFLKNKNFYEFNLVLDVGAHKGETINLFLKNFKIKKMISFEASPKNFKSLISKLNYFKTKYINSNIIMENIALADEKKLLSFKQFNESSSSTIAEIDENSSYYKKKYKILNFFGKNKNYKMIEIQTNKLCDYLVEHKLNLIDFLKIDTEGYEYEVLKGLEDKIKDVKIIMFEHHYDNMIKKKYTYSDIHKFLSSNSFKQIYKAKMPFRKTFEYIYINKE